MPGPLHDPNETLRLALLGTQRRLTVRKAVRGASGGLWIGVVIGCAGAGLTHHALGWTLGASLGLVFAGVGGAIAIGAVLAMSSGRLGRRELALLLDRSLQTEELLITALHLGEADLSARDELLAELRLDPDAIARSLPVKIPKHTRWVAIPALLIPAILAAPPWSQRAPESRGALQAVGARLETRIEEDAAGTAELPNELERQIADLASDMQGNKITEEEALERIDELQEHIQAFTETLAASENLLDDLEEAARALEAEASQDLAEALREGDLEAAAEATEDLSERLARGTPAERAEVSDDLRRAGDVMSESENEALRQTGRAMKNAGEQLDPTPQPGAQNGATDPAAGPDGPSQEQLRDLTEQLEKARQLGERLQRDQRALDRSQRLNGAMEAGKERLGGETEVPSGESSQADGGEAAGAGNTDQPGAADALTGTPKAGKAHTWEDEGEFTDGGQQVARDRNSDATEGEVIDDFEKLYEPLRMEGAKALLASVDGPVDEQGQIDDLHTRITGADEEAQRTPLDVPAAYREAAVEAMNNESIPPAYRDAVKQYFDEME